uniref:SH3 domain containing protein n=1 Tax=Endocarpon pusillum TaxID=364733 RepID=F8QX39_9EURO|nr:SH3 domain containing protein [Endocarpon pusillum]
MASEASIALTNRALRTIKTELEFLTDSSVISPQQLSSILSQLPAQTQVHAPVHSPVPSTIQPFSNLSLNNEKNQYIPSPVPAPPPPAYASGPQVLSLAIALYAYAPTDAGDLALQQNDRVQVTEHMNNDWWRGRNERTGLEGIFPRSYVNIVEEKRPQAVSPHVSNYGNMPLEVSQSSSAMTPVDGKKPSKLEENGKKFGRRWATRPFLELVPQ